MNERKYALVFFSKNTRQKQYIERIFDGIPLSMNDVSKAARFTKEEAVAALQKILQKSNRIEPIIVDISKELEAKALEELGFLQ